MKSKNLRNLFLAAVALLMVCQLGWAQSAAIPPDKTLAAKAVAAVQATGTPVPVVPVSSIAGKAAARPGVWLSSSLGAKPAFQAPGNGEPSYCDFNNGSQEALCPLGLQTAYNVKQIVGGNGGAGIVIAIVDALAYPNAEANLARFDSDMGLPACTTANGCFTSVVMTGAATANGTGWDIESMLDLEYAHAMAPNAKLIYVQAKDASDEALGAAVAVAAASADIVSNSWIGAEYTAYDSYWNVGKVLLFASGDYSNWPAQGEVGYPCSALTVTCVGGTTLHVNAKLQRTSETGWSGAGGGCSGPNPVPGGDGNGSGYESMPSWQGRNGSDVCSPYRAAPDIAAIADPNTPVAVYVCNPGLSCGYYGVGGTSVATPVSAGLVANIDTARVSFGKAKFTFLNPSLYNAAASNYNYFFYDVLSGSNGFNAGPQFDLVTGLGVSNGPAMANRFFGLIFNPQAP
jgi:subtilase family serine protease